MTSRKQQWVRIVSVFVMVVILSAGGTVLASGTESVSIDDWAVEVWCSGICMDLNWDTTASAEDFQVVIAACGHSVADWKSQCLEGVFSRDGFIDHLDIVSWDWSFVHYDLMVGCQPIPLVCINNPVNQDSDGNAADANQPILGSDDNLELSDLLILGKRQKGDSLEDVLKDRLYGLGLDGLFMGVIEQSGLSDRCQVHLVRSEDGQVYVINSREGVIGLDDRRVLLGVKQIQVLREPRYGQSATVSVGIQKSGDQVYGRPVLDAVITGESIYVVPVVIVPQTGEAYLAGARVSRAGGSVDRIYDDPNMFDPSHADNPNLTGLREIEVDGSGNVYVLNVQQINRSTMLWKYESSGQILKRIDLDDLGIVDPVGLCLSRDGRSLYMGTGQYGEDTSNTWIYVLATEDLSLSRKIQVKGLQRTTSITEDGTGVLWVVGFNLDRVDSALDIWDVPGYQPVLARIEPGQTQVEAISFAGVASDLALPMSVVWTGN